MVPEVDSQSQQHHKICRETHRFEIIDVQYTVVCLLLAMLRNESLEAVFSPADTDYKDAVLHELVRKGCTNSRGRTKKEHLFVLKVGHDRLWY